MCFSATASFVAGTSLSVIGVATLRRAENRSEIPFALIPLLFGIQQLTEGIVWLTFGHDALVLRQVASDIYSGFSHVLWPIYVPFAVGLMEATRWRKRALSAFQIAGLAVGLYLLYSMITRPLVADVVGRHVVYDSPHFFLPVVIVLYVASTCVSCFFSSHRFVNVFGVLALLSFIATYVLYTGALVSVWCFFAAILSTLIYVHLRYRNLGGFPVSSPNRIATDPAQGNSYAEREHY